MKNKFHMVLIALLFFALSGCSYFSRRTIQQGNELDAQQISRLQKGMNKKQVAELLGSHLVDNTFDKNRWDYVYTYQGSFKRKVYRRVTIKFKNNQVVAIEKVNA